MATKTKRTIKGFFPAVGEATKRVAADSIGFFIQEVGADEKPNGNEIRQTAADYPAAILSMASLWGLSTALTNVIGGKDSEWEEAEARNENFRNGEWQTEGESGPRLSVLAEAAVAAREAAGKPITLELALEKLRAMDTAGRKAFKADPKVLAEFETIMLRKAQERAKAAKASAKAATGPSALDSF
jgi:hypothetical protein